MPTKSGKYKYYVPKPVFDTKNEAIRLYKDAYASDKPHAVLRQWLNICFKNSKTNSGKSSKIDIPSWAIKDYQHALNFLYSYLAAQILLLRIVVIWNACCNGAGLFAKNLF